MSCSHKEDFDDVLGCGNVINLPNHMETGKKKEGLDVESKKDWKKRKKKVQDQYENYFEKTMRMMKEIEKRQYDFLKDLF